jgi:hypothetical protein
MYVVWMKILSSALQVPYQLEFAEWLAAEGPDGGVVLAEQLLLTAAGVLTVLVAKGGQLITVGIFKETVAVAQRCHAREQT